MAAILLSVYDLVEWCCLDSLQEVEWCCLDSLQELVALVLGDSPAASDNARSISAMRELLDDLDRWRSKEVAVAIARVVDVEGSGPRLVGAAMAVTEDGEVSGSVSGGCVEGAVVVEALEVLASSERRLVVFGYSDDEASEVGLTCGGTVHLFIEPLDW